MCNYRGISTICQEFLRNFVEFHKKRFIMETLAERIKLIRGKLSQQEFSDKLGVNRSIIADLERGKTKKPNKYVEEKLEQIFHINPQWLLTGEGEMYKNEKIIINAPNNIVNSHNAKISINEAINSLPPEIATVAKYMLNLPEKQRLEFIACMFSKCGKE